MSMHEWWFSWSGWWWTGLLDHIWQATLFALLVFVINLMLGGAPARARYLVWLLALVKFALPAALVLMGARALGFDGAALMSALTGARPTVSAIVQMAEPSYYLIVKTGMAESSGHSELYCLLSLLWLAGVALTLGYWWRRRREFLRAVRAGQIVMRGREAASLARVCRMMFIDREIGLILSPAVSEPGVWGMLKPVVVLPEGIAAQLSDEELDAVMMHEMVHVMRRDNLTSNLQMLLCCCLWFHPFVWLIDRRLLAEREQACDERVIALSGAPRNYAATMLKVVRLCLGWQVAGLSGATSSSLKRRIRQIMASKQARFSIYHKALLCGVTLALLIFSVSSGLTASKIIDLPSGVAANSAPAAEPVEPPMQGEVINKTAAFSHNGAATGGQQEADPHIIPIGMRYIDELPVHIVRTGATLVKFTDKTGSSQAKKSLVNFSLEVYNKADKPIKRLAFYLSTGEMKNKLYVERVQLSIEPQTTYTLTEVFGDALLQAGVPERLQLAIAGVGFADGSKYGTFAGDRELAEDSETLKIAQEQLRSVQEEVRRRSLHFEKYGAEFPLKPITKIDPVYPPLAKTAKVEGDVVVEIEVDAHGNVNNARVVSGHPLLQNAAINAIRQWKFEPIIDKNGQPSVVNGKITFNFALKQ